jgi:hypothetical protein
MREHGMVGENPQSMVRPVQFRIVRQHYSGALVYVSLPESFVLCYSSSSEWNEA